MKMLETVQKALKFLKATTLYIKNRHIEFSRQDKN